MCFKMVRCCLVGLGLFLSACGLHLNEPAVPKNPLTFKGQGYQCVGQIPEHLGRYVADELSDGQINEFVNCLQGAFSAFAQLSRGRDQAHYQPEAIRNFLQEYFMTKLKISDPLLHEFMVIKQTLLGGAGDRLTRQELFTSIEVLEEIRTEALRMRPHIKFLNPQLAMVQDPQDLGKHLGLANETFKQTIKTFSSRLQKSHQGYSLKNLESFLKEFRLFVKWDEHFKNSHPAEAWVELIRRFKELTVSPISLDQIRESDWSPLLQALASWYLGFVEYSVGIKGRPVLHGVGLQNTVFLAREIFKLTEDAIQRQVNQVVTFNQIQALIVTAQNLGWIDKKIRLSSLNQLAKVLLTRVFGDSRVPPGERTSEGLNLINVANMRSEFERWSEVQQNLDRLRSAENSTHNKMHQRVPALQTIPGVSAEFRTRISGLRNPVWNNFLKVKSLMRRPLFATVTETNDKPRVYLVPQANLSEFKLEHGFDNLSYMNVFRSIVALLFRGYAEKHSEPWLWTAAIKDDEFQNFTADIRELGIDLGLIDSRTSNAGSRSFAEAKLFTYSARGRGESSYGPGSELNMVELMEYLAVLYSGSTLASEIYRADPSAPTSFPYQIARCPRGPLDLNGDSKLERACVETGWTFEIINRMHNMPGLQQFTQNLKGAERYQFGADLLRVVFSPRSSDRQWVERSEIVSLSVIMHYIEALMTRYDSNRDGILTHAEMEQAFKIFSGFIRRMQEPSMSEATARAVFFYILKERNLPTTDDWASVLWNQWIIEPNVSLDRAALTQIFKAFITKLQESTDKIQAAPEPPQF